MFRDLILIALAFFTLSEVANSRGKSFKAEGLYQEANKQAEQLIENEDRYADSENARKKAISYESNSSTGSGSKYSCSILCRGSLYATGSRFTMEAWGNSGVQAGETIKAQADKQCEQSAQSSSWWADVDCKAKALYRFQGLLIN